MEFTNVTATVFNIYFDGKVVSHAITTAVGRRKPSESSFPANTTSAPKRPSVRISRAVSAIVLDGTEATLAVALASPTFPPTPASPSP